MSWRVTWPGTTGCCDAWVNGWTGSSTAPLGVVHVLRRVERPHATPAARPTTSAGCRRRGRDGLDGGRQLGVGRVRRHVDRRVDRARHHLGRGEGRRGVDQRSGPGPQRHVVEVAGVVRAEGLESQARARRRPTGPSGCRTGSTRRSRATGVRAGRRRRRRSWSGRRRSARPRRSRCARRRSSRTSAWSFGQRPAGRRRPSPVSGPELRMSRCNGVVVVDSGVCSPSSHVSNHSSSRAEMFTPRARRDVLPRAHQQLVARRDRLARRHGGVLRPPVVEVLQADVVHRLARLEEVVPAADQEGGDVVGHDGGQVVRRAARRPVRTVERLRTLAGLDVEASASRSRPAPGCAATSVGARSASSPSARVAVLPLSAASTSGCSAGLVRLSPDSNAM